MSWTILFIFLFGSSFIPSLKTRAENQKFLVVKGIIDYSCVLFDKSWALLQELSSKLFSSVFYSSLLLLTALIRLVGGTSQWIVSPCLFEVPLFQQSPSPSTYSLIQIKSLNYFGKCSLNVFLWLKSLYTSLQIFFKGKISVFTS